MPYGGDETVRALLDLPTWAVVGLSGHPGRAAYGVAAVLQRNGRRVVPVHPRAADLLGERAYPSLADVPFPIDVVDVFRRSDAAGAVADEAVAVGAVGVWFQLGVVDLEAYARVTASGTPMVMDRCPVIDWPRHGTRAAVD